MVHWHRCKASSGQRTDSSEDHGHRTRAACGATPGCSRADNDLNYLVLSCSSFFHRISAIGPQAVPGLAPLHRGRRSLSYVDECPVSLLFKFFWVALVGFRRRDGRRCSLIPWRSRGRGREVRCAGRSGVLRWRFRNPRRARANDHWALRAVAAMPATASLLLTNGAPSLPSRVPKVTAALVTVSRSAIWHWITQSSRRIGCRSHRLRTTPP
jgi:hypothetical protein